MRFSQLAISALIAASSAKASVDDASFDDIIAPPKPASEKSEKPGKVEHPPFQVSNFFFFFSKYTGRNSMTMLKN